MGLFLKSRGQDLEISSNICSTVDLGHLKPMGVKGLYQNLEILILAILMVFTMEYDQV